MYLKVFIKYKEKRKNKGYETPLLSHLRVCFLNYLPPFLNFKKANTTVKSRPAITMMNTIPSLWNNEPSGTSAVQSSSPAVCASGINEAPNLNKTTTSTIPMIKSCIIEVSSFPVLFLFRLSNNIFFRISSFCFVLDR